MLVGQKHMIRIVGWKDGNTWPDGQLLFTLGEDGSFATESEALLYEAGVSSLFYS